MPTSTTITDVRLIGCPITAVVTANNFGSDITFQRIRLVVDVYTYQPETLGGTFEFTKPCNGGDTVEIDISSALRAVAETHKYKADVLSYPQYKYIVKAYDDYMRDGVFYKGISEVTVTCDRFLYAGTLSDRQRLTDKVLPVWSRKPTSSPEIVYMGMIYLKPGAYSSSPAVTAYNVVGGRQIQAGDSDPVSIDGIYGIARPEDAYELRFINSLGVHESIHTQCLITGETTIQTDRFIKSQVEKWNSISSGVTRKQNDHERWKMSSPPLDRQWQQWYLHEFLMAKWAWIKIDNQWLQVHILPGETVPGIDRVKATPLTVEFTIEFDINGSPFD